ncbi:nanos homolog 3 isoform X2 [Macaca fascicularis]|uniref:nanos homolog 3 isoform X2 n=1 Tax=Macaca fascicularis TaxID=9541 RepID=UPI003D158A1A
MQFPVQAPRARGAFPGGFWKEEGEMRRRPQWRATPPSTATPLETRQARSWSVLTRRRRRTQATAEEEEEEQVSEVPGSLSLRPPALPPCPPKRPPTPGQEHPGSAGFPGRPTL